MPRHAAQSPRGARRACPRRWRWRAPEGRGGGRVPHRGLPVPGRAGRARPFGLGGEQRGGAQQRSEDDVPDGSGRHGRPGGQGEGGARAARAESSTGEGGARAARPESTTGWRGADANPGVRPATKVPCKATAPTAVKNKRTARTEFVRTRSPFVRYGRAYTARAGSGAGGDAPRARRGCVRRMGRTGAALAQRGAAAAARAGLPGR